MLLTYIILYTHENDNIMTSGEHAYLKASENPSISLIPICDKNTIKKLTVYFKQGPLLNIC